MTKLLRFHLSLLYLLGCAATALPAAADDSTVIKQAMPAVVNISTTTKPQRAAPARGEVPLPDDPVLRRFFEQLFPGESPRERGASSLGSGVIIDSSGLIVTNNHVVERADDIRVLLSDKREFKARVIGRDPPTDIAVIKIDANNLPQMHWGDSDRAEVGKTVYAIGNPLGLNRTVTSGIVSAVGRANIGIADYEDFIQTDAAINPGNSGGALINTAGELIGINTAIFSQSGGYMGIGFAVPSNMARPVMASLIKQGKVVRGWLGVSVQEVTSELAKQFGLQHVEGVVVTDVAPNSPAAKAGLRSGDVIVGFQGKEFDSAGTLRNAIAQTPPGTPVKLTIVRGKSRQDLTANIEEQPQKPREREAPPPVQQGLLSGLQVQTLTQDVAQRLGLPANTAGMVVVAVAPDSAAANSGVRPGDVIAEIDRQSVGNAQQYSQTAKRLQNADRALMLIQRADEKLFVVLTG